MSDYPKSGTRVRQKIARRQAILAAAERALGADDDVSVDSIANEAGLAKGTVYNYFPDKASLVEAVMQAVEARVLGEIVAGLPIATPQTRLALLLCSLLKFAIDDPGGAVIAGRRMEEVALQGGAIGHAIWAELRASGYSSAMTGEEPSAAMTLMLSTMRAAMHGIVDVPVARRRARAAAIVVLCLCAVGARRTASEAAVEAALDRLASPRRGLPQDHERPSAAY